MSDHPSDPRRHLLIDRFSHVLDLLSERRRAALGVPGSVESVTWNVFRSLGQIDPALWLPALMRRALGRALRFTRRELDSLRVSLWEPVAPPPARQDYLRRRARRGTLVPPAGRLRRGRVTPLSDLRLRLAEAARRGEVLEPPYDIGAVLRTERRVIYVVPALGEEIDMDVPCDRRRDALLRALDAGLYEAEAARRRPRRFYLVLLFRDRRDTPRSVALLRAYRRRPAALERALAHRRGLEGEAAARGLGLIRWRSLARALRGALYAESVDPLQRLLLGRMLEYLRGEGLLPGEEGPD